MTVPSSSVERPPALRWLYYALGGGLPERYAPWVLRDVSAPGWVWRHVVRCLIQVAVPIGLLIVLLPGPAWIRLLAAFGGLLMGLFYSLGYMEETCAHRLVKAGYAADAAVPLRREHEDAKSAGHAVRVEQRLEKARVRRERRSR